MATAEWQLDLTQDGYSFSKCFINSNSLQCSKLIHKMDHYSIIAVLGRQRKLREMTDLSVLHKTTAVPELRPNLQTSYCLCLKVSKCAGGITCHHMDSPVWFEDYRSQVFYWLLPHFTRYWLHYHMSTVSLVTGTYCCRPRKLGHLCTMSPRLPLKNYYKPS